MPEIKHDSFELINAYFRARDKEDTYNEISFECPLCHGIAKGSTCESNGHFRVACVICGIKVMS